MVKMKCTSGAFMFGETMAENEKQVTPPAGTVTRCPACEASVSKAGMVLCETGPYTEGLSNCEVDQTVPVFVCTAGHAFAWGSPYRPFPLYLNGVENEHLGLTGTPL